MNISLEKRTIIILFSSSFTCSLRLRRGIIGRRRRRPCERGHFHFRFQHVINTCLTYDTCLTKIDIIVHRTTTFLIGQEMDIWCESHWIFANGLVAKYLYGTLLIFFFVSLVLEHARTIWEVINTNHKIILH